MSGVSGDIESGDCSPIRDSDIFASSSLTLMSGMLQERAWMTAICRRSGRKKKEHPHGLPFRKFHISTGAFS